MEAVRRLGWVSARFAARAISSASACNAVSGQLLGWIGVGACGMKATYLCLGVILGLVLSADDWPLLAGIDQVAFVVAHNACRTREHQRLDTTVLRCRDDRSRALDIDLAE